MFTKSHFLKKYLNFFSNLFTAAVGLMDIERTACGHASTNSITAAEESVKEFLNEVLQLIRNEEHVHHGVYDSVFVF